MKTVGAIRFKASALRSEPDYLAVRRGQDDSEWLQTAIRVGEGVLRLETASNRFATIAKGLGAYVGFVFEM